MRRVRFDVFLALVNQRSLPFETEILTLMSDVFVSYAQSTEKQADQVVGVLRALGYGVWRDDELLEPVLAAAGESMIKVVEGDVDLDSVRDIPRFKKMIADAKARLDAAAVSRTRRS